MKSKIEEFKVKGLVAAVFTPMKENGDINLEAIAPYAQQLLNDGVKNIFPCGTTGEGASLTVEERMQVVEEWIRVGKNKFDAIIVHVGMDALRYTRMLAAHAVEKGADAISVVTPMFFKPSTVDLLLQYLSEVSKAAPTLPLYYYHNPGFTGLSFSLEKIWEGLKKTPVPTLRGAKFTDSNMWDLSRVQHLSEGRLQLLYSYDQQLPEALMMGIEAFVGSTYNYAGKGANKLIAAFQRGDKEAMMEEYAMYLSFIPLIIKYGGDVGANKCMMKVAKLPDIGPARLPNKNLSSEELTNLAEDMRAIGFLEWIN